MFDRQILERLRRALRWWAGKAPSVIGRHLPERLWVPPHGKIKFGDLGRTLPISTTFGFDRGNPIDRYFIENFLSNNARNIRGRVLEVGDNSYTVRFGGEKVSNSDVLHVDATNPAATIIGDLSRPGTLPAAKFDCIVLTQTLHLIYDMPKALAEVAGALKPGGTLLVTVPGITSIDRGEWGRTWYWALTEAALFRLLREVFNHRDIVVETSGNVFAAVCFLQGLAVSEVPKWKLDVRDGAFPVIVAAKAVKRPA